HLAIGVVEGLATAVVLQTVYAARPELLRPALPATGSLRPVLAGLLLLTVFLGGIVAWFASTHPDGLEWALARTAGTTELEAHYALHGVLARVQELTAFMPGYAFPAPAAVAAAPPAWPAVDPGTTAAGLLGAGMTLGVALLAGRLLRCRRRPAAA
ncbi:MAG TPA: PDGLE domain-containing protein, partial [bacterium]|nr:PDGLE domain-containing protein [bacterium]